MRRALDRRTARPSSRRGSLPEDAGSETSRAEVFLSSDDELPAPRVRFVRLVDEHLRLHPDILRAPRKLLAQLDDSVVGLLPPLITVRRPDSNTCTIIGGHITYALSLRVDHPVLVLEYPESSWPFERIARLQTIDRALFEGLPRVLRAPSRPTIARKKHLVAGQTCPACGPTKELRGPRDWRQRLARGVAGEISCRYCGLCLPVSSHDLRRFVCFECSTADLWRIDSSSRCPDCCPSCDAASVLVCVGRAPAHPRLCICAARGESCHAESQS